MHSFISFKKNIPIAPHSPRSPLPRHELVVSENSAFTSYKRDQDTVVKNISRRKEAFSYIRDLFNGKQ
jgi:hypothetical protein